MTFDRGVNIKETCWNLQNIRVSRRRRQQLLVVPSACLTLTPPPAA